VDEDFNLQGNETVLTCTLLCCICYSYQSTRSHIAERIISVHSQSIRK